MLLSVGSLVAQNVLDALAGRRQALWVGGANSLAEAAGNFRCDQAWLLPPMAERARCKARLEEVLAAAAPDLVIPGRDDDVLLLAELLAEQPALAGRLLVGSVAMARMMDDKLASYEFAVRHGLPFVTTVASDGPDAPEQLPQLYRRHGFPLIAKPRAGNGSRGIRILTEEGHLAKVCGVPGYVVQPMIDPPAELTLSLAEGLPFFWGVQESSHYGVQFLIDPQGSLSEGCAYLSTMVMGRSESLFPCADAGLLAAAQRYAEQAAREGWRGPLNIQFRHAGAGQFLAIELNGRFTGASSARSHFGFDEVGRCLQQWLGADALPLAVAEGVAAVGKSLSDFPVPQQALQTLRESGTWRKGT